MFDPDEDHKSEFNFRHLNNEEVYKALVNLNPTKASGADNIPAKALKVAAGQIAPSLAYLFNQSFQQGVFPTFWKTAKVTALPKGKDNTLCDNFRPISLLPCPPKVMEKFSNNQLQAFALEHNLISREQFAYQKIPDVLQLYLLLQISKNGPETRNRLTLLHFLISKNLST